MPEVIRYKNYTIHINSSDYDISQGKHTLLCGLAGIDENPLEHAKSAIDRDFLTSALLELRKLPPTKR